VKRELIALLGRDIKTFATSGTLQRTWTAKKSAEKNKVKRSSQEKEVVGGRREDLGCDVLRARATPRETLGGDWKDQID